MIALLLIGCGGEAVRVSLADPRYAAPPALPEAMAIYAPVVDTDDGTATPAGFLPDGRGGMNIARGDDAILIRFGRVDPGVFARLVLPVAIAHQPRIVAIRAEIDGRPSVAEVRWTFPVPLPDPWAGPARKEPPLSEQCAPFLRSSPDLTPLLAEAAGRPLAIRLEAIEGEIAVWDSAQIAHPECPGRLTPTLEVAESLRQSLAGKEMLVRPTDHEASVAVFPLLDVEVAVELGMVRGSFQSAPAGKRTEIRLDNLAADASYEWRLWVRRGDQVEVGPSHPIHTQRGPGASFRFGVTADGHLLNMVNRRAYSSMHLMRSTYRAMRKDDLDFLIDLGDSFNSESYRSFDAPDDEEALRRHLAVRPYFELANAPVFAVVGNHEGEQGWQGAIRERAVRARNETFPNPRPDAFYSGNALEPEVRDYYAFTWGDLLIVVLDPYRYTTRKPHAMDGGPGTGDRWDWTLGLPQYRWLEETLEGSDAAWKLVFAHQLTGGTNEYGRGGAMAADSYEWGGAAEFAEKRPGWGRPVHRVLADTGVTAFIHGHDHVFAFETPKDGVAYLTAPQPGDALADFGHASRTDFAPAAVVIPSSGYLRFEAEPDGLTVV